MPIMQSCAEPERFTNVLYAAIGTLTGVYIFFGIFGYCAYGNSVEPIVTENLPPAALSTIIMKFVFSLNLICGFSIVIAPANTIAEHWLIDRCVSNSNKFWATNCSRFLVCFLVVFVGLKLANKIDKF